MTPNQFIKDFIKNNKAELSLIACNEKVLNSTWQNNKILTDFEKSFFKEFFDFDIITFNLLGHFNILEGKTIQEIEKEDKYFPFDIKMITSRIQSILQLSFNFYMNNFKELKPIKGSFNPFLNDDIIMISETACPDCGVTVHTGFDIEKQLFTITEFYRRYQKGKRCAFENVEKTIKSNLDVPSGKMVFTNSFYKMLNEEQQQVVRVNYSKEGHSLNAFSGRKLRSEQHQELNIACFSGGDFTLTNKSTSSLFLSDLFDQDNNDGINDYLGEYIDTIYCCPSVTEVMDYSLYLSMCKENDFDPNELDIVIVDVEKGEYVFLDYYDNLEKNNGINVDIKMKK